MGFGNKTNAAALGFPQPCLDFVSPAASPRCLGREIQGKARELLSRHDALVRQQLTWQSGPRRAGAQPPGAPQGGLEGAPGCVRGYLPRLSLANAIILITLARTAVPEALPHAPKTQLRLFEPPGFQNWLRQEGLICGSACGRKRLKGRTLGPDAEIAGLCLCLVLA